MADLEKLLSRVDLIDLAEKAGAKFQHRAGRDARSVCPLHGGDNATAFSVYRNGSEIQHWHCYTACDCGGDAIEFIQRWKALDFPEAVQELASLYRVSLEDIGWNQPRDVQAETERRQRLDLLTAAAGIFTARMFSDDGEQARAYLSKRGLTYKTMQSLGWGFTRSDDLLSKTIRDTEAARRVGLIRADGTDFTANASGCLAGPHGWIVFPHRVGERVTYFSSRAVELEGQPRPDPADKSRNLPGHRQVYRCELAASYEQVTLVEGPLDAATLYQSGRSAWALCGLGSLPDDDLARLKKRQAVHIATDSDDVGADALTRPDGKLAKSMTAIGPLTMILPALPAGKDFNAWLQSGEMNAEALDNLYGRASTWLETRLEQAACCPDSESETRMLEIGHLLNLVPEAAQPRYYRLANKHLGLTRRDIQNLVRQAAQSAGCNVLASIRDGQLCFANRPLMNGSINITHELVMDDGQDMPRVRYTVAGKLVSGQPLDCLDIDAEEFDQFKWVPRHWGRAPILYVNRGQYYELARAVQEMSADAVRERVYTYTGWTQIENQRVFLSATGAVTPEGHNPAIRVDLGMNNLRHYALPAPPTGEELYDAIQASLEFLDIGPRQVTAPIWAAMFAAPLTELMPLYAVLWVYGQTQSGKSTLVHLALTHFGSGFIQGRQYHAPIDWTSTGTALEGAMFTAKDAPIIIDDFAPQFASAADSRDMHRKAHITIRSVGNRSSRGRARADLTARKERVPRGLVISTAENPLMGQSIVGRMIYVPVGRGDIVPLDGKTTNPLLDQAQECGQRGLYSQAMSAFIQWLSANWGRVAKELPGRLDKAVEYAREKYPAIQGRLPDYFALLAVSQKLALECYMELGCITPHETERWTKENVAAILAVIAQQAERIATESPVRKVFEALGSLQARKKTYLAPHTQVTAFLPPDKAELIGWYGTKHDERDLVYLDTRQCLIVARDYWSGLAENLDILPDAFLLQVRQIPGLIAKPGEAGRAEASVYISGKTRRVLALSRQRALDLYGVDLANESATPTQTSDVEE